MYYSIFYCMKIPTQPTQNMYSGSTPGFNMGDMKQQLMTLFLLRSTTSGTNGSGDGGIYTMIWTLFIVSIVDKLFQYIPNIIEMYQRKLDEYTKNKLQQLSMTTNLTENIQKKETSRITIKVDVKKTDNIVGDAILDYITNAPNIEKIVYLNKTYLLNNIEPIHIDAENDIHVKLHNQLQIDETSDDNTMVQIISVYSYMLDIYELRKFVEKITYDYHLKIQNKLGDDIYFFDAIQLTPFTDSEGNVDYTRMPNTITFTMKKFVTNRKFKNVIGEQARRIQKRVEFFKNNKKWYDDKGIPYTLGLLLSGPPGGGKTSTIKCVANEMKRHIINVKLTDCITKTQMENLFFNDTITVVVNGRNESFIIPLDKRLYVFEDVDCQNSDIVLDREMVNNEISMEEIRGEHDDDEFTNILYNGSGSGNANNVSNTSNASNSNTTRNETNKTHIRKPVRPPTISDFTPYVNNLNLNYEYKVLAEHEFTTASELETRRQTKDKLKNIYNIYDKTNNKTQPQKRADHPSLEKHVSSEKLSLSCLLNIFDGVLETPGRIIIMTSNYPKKLDRALIRPGRIDLICEFSKCNPNMTIELFEAFYDIILSEEEKQRIHDANQNMYTPAELTKIMFENFNNYKDAIMVL